MSVDPKGLQPGLSQPEPAKPKTIAMRCKMEGCDSREVVEVLPSKTPTGASHQRIYQCVECHNSWSVEVGGFFPF
jgi:DNA-directed RNA polymerase subunit M/transcription elongation factor TFIIS